MARACERPVGRESARARSPARSAGFQRDLRSLAGVNRRSEAAATDEAGALEVLAVVPQSTIYKRAPGALEAFVVDHLSIIP
ncbi:hypothetical protein GCM10009060_15850 [Halorubrum trapanicum]